MKKSLYLSILILMLMIPALRAEEQAAKTESEPATTEAAAQDQKMASDTSTDAAATEAPAAGAQDEADTDSDYTFGTVSKISKDQVTIKEFDDQSGQEVENTYKIAPDAEWENVKSFEEVKPGDYAEIDYTVQNNDKVASFISIESMTEEAAAAQETKENKENKPQS